MADELKDTEVVAAETADEKVRANLDQSSSEDSADERDAGKGKVKQYFRKKVCRFCANKIKIDYKDADNLRRFTTERGKILPRRITGTCAKHQREVSSAIKRARNICLLPFVAD